MVMKMHAIYQVLNCNSRQECDLVHSISNSKILRLNLYFVITKLICAVVWGIDCSLLSGDRIDVYDYIITTLGALLFLI